MQEKNHNDKTLQTYETKLQEYIKSTPQQINEAEYPWIDQALSLIPKGGKILELGSGFGRNAEYIQEQGYSIECTDAVQEFVDILQQKGLKAHFLDALKDDFGSEYDMVFANGVLVHFTPEETANVMSKVNTSLKSGGIFAFSVKQGDGSKWTDEKLGAPRFFHYWQAETLKQLAGAHGFEWVAMLEGKTSLKNASWLYVIARKTAK